MSRIALLKAADAVLGSLFCRLLGHLPAVAVANESSRLPAPADVRNVLVIRPGGMGDMIVLLPVIGLLRDRFPNACVDIVCEKRNLPVLRLADADRDAIAYDGNPFRFLWRLHRTAYDVVLDTEQFHNFSAVFGLLSGAAVRIGFKINPRRNPLYTHLVNYSPDGREGEQFLRLLEPLGVMRAACEPDSAVPRPATELPPWLRDEIREATGEGPFAVIHIGASTVFKRWDTGKFAALARRLREQLGLAVVLVGDRRDAQTGRKISREAGTPDCQVVCCSGRLDLEMTAAVMARSALFVGVDSGLAHLAVALGLRTVVLFGPTDHLKWGTREELHAIVREDLPCAPCFIFGYHKPCRSIACMRRIGVDEVMEACARVVSSR